VQQICDDAEVAVSTFYGYFPSKEATVFLDDDVRADQVAAVITEGPAGDPPHRLLRRATLALAEHDLVNRAEMARRLEVIGREPALSAYAARRQSEHTERFAALLAERLGLDGIDLRSRLAVAMTVAAVNAAWSAWLSSDRSDLISLANQAHDVLDTGLARTF
jgi:AcrR family transcriptional regulator